MSITINDLHDDETRVRDGATGGEKGAKLTQVGALDPVSLIELARVAGMGAQKYEAFNFLKGYDWSLSFNAAMRHLLLFWAGEDRDPESHLPHLAHAAWNCLTLISFLERDLGHDNRPPRLETKAPAPQDSCRVCGQPESAAQHHAVLAPTFDAYHPFGIPQS